MNVTLPVVYLENSAMRQTLWRRILTMKFM